MAQTVLVRTCFSVSGQESKAYFERRVPWMCLQMRRYACSEKRQQSDAAYNMLIHAMVIHSRWQRVVTVPSCVKLVFYSSHGTAGKGIHASKLIRPIQHSGNNLERFRDTSHAQVAGTYFKDTCMPHYLVVVFLGMVRLSLRSASGADAIRTFRFTCS